MSRKKKTSPPQKHDGFSNESHHIRFYDYQLTYCLNMLNGNAFKVFAAIKSQYKGTDYKDGIIRIPYHDISRMTGITNRNLISKALKDLADAGLIDMKSGGLMRIPNEYKLSDRWKDKYTEWVHKEWSEK